MAFPQLVASGPTFLPILKPSFSTTVQKKLAALGVKLHFGSQVDTTGHRSGKIEKTTFKLSGGEGGTVEGNASLIMILQDKQD